MKTWKHWKTELFEEISAVTPPPCPSEFHFFSFGSFKLATTCLSACVACQSISRLSSVHSWKEWTFFFGGGVSIYVHVSVSFVNIHDIIHYYFFFWVLFVVYLNTAFNCWNIKHVLLFFGASRSAIVQPWFSRLNSRRVFGERDRALRLRAPQWWRGRLGLWVVSQVKQAMPNGQRLHWEELYLELQMSQCDEFSCNINCGKLLM